MEIQTKQLFARGICTDYEPAHEWNDDRTAPKVQRKDASGRPVFRFSLALYPAGGGRPLNGAVFAAPGKVPPAFGSEIALDGVTLVLSEKIEERRIRQQYSLTAETLSGVS